MKEEKLLKIYEEDEEPIKGENAGEKWKVKRGAKRKREKKK